MTQNTTSSRSPGERAFPVIDFHVHMLEEEVFKASSNKTVTTGFGTSDGSMRRRGGENLMGKMFSPEAQLADMDARGIDISVITADRKSTRLNSSHTDISRMPSSA